MPYTTEQVRDLETDLVKTQADLFMLYGKTFDFGQSVPSAKAKEHLHQGIARRLNVLRSCLIKVFELFPVSATRPLESSRLYEVQIYLHAFVINLYGIFDNYAWSFIYQHGLEADFDDPRRVGLFKAKVQARLPDPIRAFLQAQDICDWHRNYLTNYRDALAHRIPLYVPPSVLNQEQESQFRLLQDKINAATLAQDWSTRDSLFSEQSQVGGPCFSFIHSFNEVAANHVLLHPQMVSDAATVAAFGNLYLENCHAVRP
jgi:hypothetical protein